MDQQQLLPIGQAIDQSIELSKEELYEQIGSTKNDIDILLAQADRVFDQTERLIILNQAIVKYKLYEKLYYIYELRIMKEKKLIVRDFLENNPVIQKYRALRLIRN